MNININSFQFIWNYFDLHYDYHIIAVAYLWCNNSTLPRERLVVGEWRIIHWPRDFGQSMRFRNRFDDPTIIITLEAVDCQGWHVIMILARNWVIAPHGRVRPFLECYVYSTPCDQIDEMLTQSKRMRCVNFAEWNAPRPYREKWKIWSRWLIRENRTFK